MAFMATIWDLGLLFYIFLGFRWFAFLISHSSLLTRGKKREVSVSVSQGLDGISGLLSRNLPLWRYIYIYIHIYVNLQFPQ